MASFHGRNIVLAFIESGGSSYSALAQVDDISGAGVTRAEATADGYGSTAIGKVFDPAVLLAPITVRCREDPSGSTHDEATGIAYWVYTNTVTSIEIRGPSYSAPDTDVFRVSGQWTGYNKLTPKDDVQRFEATFTPDGSYLNINGTAKVNQTV